MANDLFEKASVKWTELDIELTDGTSKKMSNLTKDDLPKIKLDGKLDKDTKKFTSITLKRAVVKDTPTEYIEQRLFKYADGDVVFYPLPIPTNEESFNKIPFATRIAKFVKGLRIDSDHDNAGGGGMTMEEKVVNKAIKAGANAELVDGIRKLFAKHAKK